MTLDREQAFRALYAEHFDAVLGYALRRYAVPPTGTKPSTLPVEW